MPNWSQLAFDLAPHGYCLSWQPYLMWLHGLSDLVTAVAYYSIPVLLAVFAWRRQDLQFRWMFALFGVFIMACGATHIMSLWTLWRPDYLAAGLVKAFTAAVSAATAILLYRLVPRALAIPGPGAWQAINANLLAEVEERRAAEAEVRRLNAELEARVAARTAELEAANNELRQREASLQRSQQLFARLIESAPHAMVLAGRDGRIALVNGETEKVFGYPRQELIGEAVEILIPERFRAQHPGHRGAFFAQPSGRAMGGGRDIYGRHRDGREIPVELGLNPIASDEGDLVLVCIVDITERRLAEAERQARQVAEAASRAKSEFLANMSHELRTPLHAVLGYAQLLRRDPGLSERQAGGLDTIAQSGQHLLTLINDLLDLAKIEAGKLELRPAPVNLAAFLGGVADIVRLKAEDKSLHFAWALPADLPPVVEADDKRLRQVLLNLLANGVKFTDRGEVGLKVEVLARDGNSARLRFEVADTGPGMTAAELKAIFLPFEQVGDPERRGMGTGLGLAISRQLVQLMGSDIAVDSTPGQGSRFSFTVTLPVLAAANLPAPEASVTGYRGARRQVLIVDDGVGNRALLADLLGGLGFTLAQAVDGAEAVAAVAAGAPDLVLMDLVMPVLGGEEAIRRIRALPGGERLPIIAVSASASREEQAAALAAGADAFLTKPIDQDRLLAEIGQRLGVDWERAGQLPAAAAVESASAAAPLAPPRGELEVLHQLALTGNMRDIRAHADYLASLDPRYGLFAQQLQRLAQAYQSKLILALVKEHLLEQPKS